MNKKTETAITTTATNTTVTTKTENVTNSEDFIMRPTVDVCFAGLMENPTVRKGFCSAILRIPPDEVRQTELLPRHLRRNYADDKLGILDVLVRMEDGSRINMEMQVKYFEYWDERALFYISKMYSDQLKSGESYEMLKKCIHVSILDFTLFPDDEECCRTIHLRDDKTGKLYSDKLELQILELKKLPKRIPEKIKDREDIVDWMLFFSGKSREEFEKMAAESIYLNEAYQELKKLSADDVKRIEYEEREKALKDYNTQMRSAERRGEERGEKRGELRGRKWGIALARKVFKLHAQGIPENEIASSCNLTLEEVREILE